MLHTHTVPNVATYFDKWSRDTYMYCTKWCNILWSLITGHIHCTEWCNIFWSWITLHTLHCIVEHILITDHATHTVPNITTFFGHWSVITWHTLYLPNGAKNFDPWSRDTYTVPNGAKYFDYRSRDTHTVPNGATYFDHWSRDTHTVPNGATYFFHLGRSGWSVWPSVLLAKSLSNLLSAPLWPYRVRKKPFLRNFL